MDSKSWYQSKTLWANITTIVGAASAYFTGAADLPVTLAVVVPAVMNIVLRLVTKTAVGG